MVEKNQVNYLKISELIESGALTTINQIIDQMNNLVLTEKDRHLFGEDIAHKVLKLAIFNTHYQEMLLSSVLINLGVEPIHTDKIKDILWRTGIFDISGDAGNSVMYSSVELYEYFKRLNAGDKNASSVFPLDLEKKSDRVFWRIPGQHSLIGPIDPLDIQSLHRIFLMERDPKFQEFVENSPSEDLEELIKSWTTTHMLFDKTRLNVMYGIFGSLELRDEDEIGELQGGTFIYRPYRSSINAIRKDSNLLQKVESISGSVFDGRRMVEVSYFKTAYGAPKHIAAGIRQALAREYLPTKSQAKKIRDRALHTLPEDTINKEQYWDENNPSTTDRIFVSFIDLTNEDSKRVAQNVGMEFAGIIEHDIEDKHETVEVWILNRKKLDSLLFQQDEFRNGLLSQRDKVLEKEKL